MYPRELKVFPEPTEEVLEKIWLIHGCDKKRREEAFNTLKEWAQTQPHLPKNIDDSKYLQQFAWSKNSMEKTKSTIDMYYTLRGALPEIFANRDPKSERLQKVFSVSAFIPLPRLTEKYERVCLWKAMVPELSEVEVEDVVKMVLMVCDIRAKYEIIMGDIYIVDFTYLTPSTLAKFTPALLKKLAVICFKGFNARIKGIHLINTPGYIDAFVGLIRAVFNKPKIRERIHVHPKGLDSLYSFVNKKYLPKEYGGDLGTCDELWDDWKETLMEFRGWFLEQESAKTDESKRPLKPLTSNDLFGFEGSFRQLSVD